MKEEKKSKEKSQSSSTSLPTIRPLVAGVDIGSTEHWVCGPAGEDGERPIRVFGTTTPQLHELVDWLVQLKVESVAMESTSVYWIPLFEMLEARGIEPVLVNARQLHNVPGRKTDCIDCQWLQQLHSCGLLRGSFRPSDAIARLRALQRQQASFVAQRTRCVQWMQKALDQMNVQVHRAVTEITGTTGMAIVRAIVAGERDPLRLAALRDYRCKKSEEQIAQHLTGNWREEHLFNLASALQIYDTLEKTIADYDARLLKELEALESSERRQQPAPAHPNKTKEKEIKKCGHMELRTALWRFSGVDLTRIDGISGNAAHIVMTEIGANICAFPSEKHFVSWLKLSPRTAISGGKPLPKKRNSLGSNRIATVLRVAATSLRRSKTALGAAFRRIARLKGAAVAVFAIARKLAQLVYRMLRYGQDYVDVGEAEYELKFQARRLASVADAAKELGYVLLKPEGVVTTV